MTLTTFAQRLTQACDDCPHVPPFGKGRQVALAKRLGVSQQGVRKWFTGEAVPRTDKMGELAEYLEVDEAWLALGVKPELSRAEKTDARRVTEGAVFIMVGLVTMGGGRCAFPSEKDPRASYVDFYAIIRGAQVAVHVCVAREIAKGIYEWFVPREYRDVRCIGFVAHPQNRQHLVGMPVETIERHKKPKAGGFVVTFSMIDGKYITGDDTWPRIRSMGDFV